MLYVPKNKLCKLSLHRQKNCKGELKIRRLSCFCMKCKRVIVVVPEEPLQNVGGWL